jgi:hypothetical protein
MHRGVFLSKGRVFLICNGLERIKMYLHYIVQPKTRVEAIVEFTLTRPSLQLARHNSTGIR